MTVRGISNFERWKQNLTLEQALDLLKASKRCDLCPAQDDCEGDAIRCGHPVRDEFGGGVSKEWSCEGSFKHWAQLKTKVRDCCYCMPKPITLLGKKMLDDGVNVQHGKLNHYHPGREPQSIAINFCPMCGRNLKE